MSVSRIELTTKQDLVVENMRLRAGIRRIQQEAMNVGKDPEMIIVDILRYATNILAGREPGEDGAPT